MGAETRRATRDAIHETKLLERCVRDIHRLLLPDEELPTTDDADHDVVHLWDESGTRLASGHNYEIDF